LLLFSDLRPAFGFPGESERQKTRRTGFEAPIDTGAIRGARAFFHSPQAPKALLFHPDRKPPGPGALRGRKKIALFINGLRR